MVRSSKQSKYHNNKPTYYDPEKKETLVFDSNKELEYYLILKDREKKKEIFQFRRQVPLTVQEAFTDKTGKKHRAIIYKADFFYLTEERREDGFVYIVPHIVDVKGYQTEVYKLKKKLLAYKGIIIEEV